MPILKTIKFSFAPELNEVFNHGTRHQSSNRWTVAWRPTKAIKANLAHVYECDHNEVFDMFIIVSDYHVRSDRYHVASISWIALYIYDDDAFPLGLMMLPRLVWRIACVTGTVLSMPLHTNTVQGRRLGKKWKYLNCHCILFQVANLFLPIYCIHILHSFCTSYCMTWWSTV